VEAEARKGLIRHANESGEVAQKTMTATNAVTGGFLCPPEMLSELIKGVIEFSPFRAVARVQTTGSRAIHIPRRTQAASAEWVGEIEERTETQNPQIGLLEVPVHELYARADVSVQDLEDAQFDLQGLLTEEFTEQFAVAEAAAFINGNGVGKPFGVLQKTEIERVPSVVADAIAATSLIDFIFALKSFYVPNAVVGLNRSTIGEIRKIQETTDGDFLWQPGLALRVPPTIVGSPYIEMSDMPDVAADAEPLMYGDFRRGYIIADRVAMTMVRDDLTLANFGQVKFMARKRLGGQVRLDEAIKIYKIEA
jgi:HK97 family phage major capsid protein